MRVRRRAIVRAMIVTCVAALGQAQCKSAMPDKQMRVSWSVSGLPPTYTERRWHADVPAALRPGVDALLQQIRFFELPADLGANDPNGRDMGSYSITVAIDARTHTVRFSDTSITADLATFRTWLTDHLASLATTE
jgi:hypothetical protein